MKDLRPLVGYIYETRQALQKEMEFASHDLCKTCYEKRYYQFGNDVIFELVKIQEKLQTLLGETNENINSAPVTGRN